MSQGHGARWSPHAWRSDSFALPMPQGAASAELYARLRGAWHGPNLHQLPLKTLFFESRAWQKVRFIDLFYCML